jgi:hypothetical protein
MARLLLIVLLPIIAAVLYLEGQQYDSTLINFQTSGQTSAEAFFPRVINGLNRSGQIQLYTRENLYEYVNGHAEYFISAGFESLSVGEYIRTGSDPDRPEVVLEIYDMGKGIQAFGVLADEAGNSMVAAETGRMAFQSTQGLSFVAGRYYIKIDLYDESIPVIPFAEKIEEKIDETSDFASLFSRFPSLGPVVGMRYIKEDYRGLGFVQNVMEREYDLNGKKVQIFLVTGEEQEIQELTDSFLKYFSDSGIKYNTIKKSQRTYYQVMDPYEGDWSLLPMDDALFGIYGAADSSLPNQIFEDAGTGVSGRGD